LIVVRHRPVRPVVDIEAQHVVSLARGAHIPQEVIADDAGARIAVPGAGEAPQRCGTPGVPVDDRLFPLHHTDPPGTRVVAGLGQRETYPEATDQKARTVWLRQHAKRSADHEPFRAAVRRVHQETSVGDDLEVLAAAAQHHFAVGPVTPLDELNGLTHASHAHILRLIGAHTILAGRRAVCDQRHAVRRGRRR
jgi:hypothetical protein